MAVKTPVVIGIALGSAVCLAAVATYVHAFPHATVPSEVGIKAEHRSNKLPKSNLKPENNYVFVFTPRMSTSGISFSTTSVAYPQNSGPVDKMIFAVNQFLKVANVTPQATTCIGVDVHNGLATIGFNPEFQAGYGSFDEKIIIDGLAVTLGQYRKVKSYDIEVNGVPLKSLGDVDLDAPIPVIRPQKDLNHPTWDPGQIDQKVINRENSANRSNQKP